MNVCDKFHNVVHTFLSKGFFHFFLRQPMSSRDCQHCDLTNSESTANCLACYQSPLSLKQKQEAITRFITSEVSLELLINGYFRKKEKELNLYMHIPMGIAQIIHSFYPVLLFKFGDFRQNLFEVNDDRTILKARGKSWFSCCGYLIYAHLEQYNDVGLNKGVHLWSVQNLAATTECHLSIGVTTEKNDKLINKWKNRNESLDLQIQRVLREKVSI